MDKYKNTEQLGLFEETEVRSLLDQLLSDARLYKTSKDYEELLDFVAKLPNFAPFNAMLLQLQKPGLTYAASAYDWKVRFGCYPKEDARPLIILWPFGPVALKELNFLRMFPAFLPVERLVKRSLILLSIYLAERKSN